MKKIFTFLAAATLIVGCSKTDEAQPSSYTITGYSTADTRTEFGTPDATSIPFLWSQGDKVWVGPKQSDALAAGGESATFTLSSAPQDGAAVYYNMTGSGATASVPTAQDATKSLGKNGDFGYAKLSNNSFALEHATSYLWFDVTTTGFDATLLSVTVDAGDAAIAGSATWSGQAFGQVNNPTSTITLEVGANVAMPAMVVLPTEVSALTVTYKFDVNGVTKYYGQTLGAKTLAAGKTYKISANDLYELRTLTFEDADAKFTAYSLDYAPKDIRTWSNLVDDAQYGGTLTYSYGGEYYWYDEGNTELFHSFVTPYWGGGHVISNYVIEDYSTLPEGHSGWYELQMANPIGGHNGSANFAVHNGYSDFFNSQLYDASLKGFEFADGVERVVDHMYVTNINYVLNSLTYGDGFNMPATEDTYLKVIAYGFNAADEKVGELEFYLCNGASNILKTWQKWDLSALGKVAKIAFNITASEDQCGSYGLNCPAYFAYDDVAVRFEK
mgnify:CR=1 FL=1